MQGISWLSWVAGALLWAWSAAAIALNPDYRLTQYAHTAWRIGDGAIASIPTAIAQTKDGYLWVGTLNGLLRFDGVRFTEDTNFKGPAISLLAGKDGGLWIGGKGQLARRNGGNFVRYGDPLGQVNAIIEDPQGIIWYTLSRLQGTDKRPLCRFEQGKSTCLGKSDGIPFEQLNALAAGSDGYLWFASATSIARWNKGNSQSFVQDALYSSRNLSGIQAIVAEPDGSVFVGISRAGPGLGLERIRDGAWTKDAIPGLQADQWQVTTLMRDRNDTLWIGTMQDGIYRLNHGQAEHFNESNGLSGNRIAALLQDQEGTVWVTTTGGIDSFRERSVITYSSREGLAVNDVDSVLGSRNGDVWVGNYGSLDRLHEGYFFSIGKAQGLPGTRVTSLMEDHLGRIWVGFDNKLTIYDHDRFREVTRADNSDIGIVLSLTEDLAHDTWAIVFGKGAWQLARLRGDQIQQILSVPQVPLAVTADPDDGILLVFNNGMWGRVRQGQLETSPVSFLTGAGPQGSALRMIAVAPDGSYYAATSLGVVAWRGSDFQLLNNGRGLPCDTVYAILVDKTGNLWASASCGIFEVAASDMGKLWNGSHPRVAARLFDALDGAVTAKSDFQPSISQSSDGRLWFANLHTLQMIDPARLPNNAVPPPVHIELITADHQSITTQRTIHLPALTRQLEIDYTGLSFVIPQKVTYKYRLEGHDADWQEVGTRRQAFYNDLPPGKYTFRVTAANNSGVWNEVGDTVAIFVAPAWYQTVWFRSVALVSLLMIAWTAYQLRLRQINATLRLRYNERLDERTRVARDLHDTLLQTIQASKLAADDSLNPPRNPTNVIRTMERLADWLGQSVQEGRAALNSLRFASAEGNDLAADLRRAFDECPKHGPMDLRITVSGKTQELHPIARDEVYRIGYEAIRNACAHALATYLVIEVRYAQDLEIRISDNGKGIDAEALDIGKPGHFGLRGMKERASRISARLTIQTSSESGTQIVLTVPGRAIFLPPVKSSSRHR